MKFSKEYELRIFTLRNFLSLFEWQVYYKGFMRHYNLHVSINMAEAYKFRRKAESGSFKQQQRHVHSNYHGYAFGIHENLISNSDWCPFLRHHMTVYQLNKIQGEIKRRSSKEITTWYKSTSLSPPPHTHTHTRRNTTVLSRWQRINAGLKHFPNKIHCDWNTWFVSFCHTAQWSSLADILYQLQNNEIHLMFL